MSDTSDLDITSDEEGQDPQRDVVSVTKILRKIIHNVDRIKKVYDGQLSITVRNARPVGNLQPFDVDGFEDVARQLLERIENRFNIYSNWNGRMNLPELTIDGARVALTDMTVAQLKRFITVLLRLTNGRRSPGFGKLQLRPIWWPAELPWRPLYRDGRAPADKNGKPWIEVLRQVVVNCYDFYDKSHLLFPGGRPDGALAPQVYPPVPRGGELAELPHNDEAAGVHMYYGIENLRQAQRPDLQPNVADDNNGAQRDMLMDAPAPAPALGQAPAAAAGPAPAANNGNAVQIKREPGIEAPTQVMTSSGVWLVDVPTHDVIPHKNCITPGTVMKIEPVEDQAMGGDQEDMRDMPSTSASTPDNQGGVKVENDGDDLTLAITSSGNWWVRLGRNRPGQNVDRSHYCHMCGHRL